MTEVMIEAVNVTKTFQISAGAFRRKRDLHAVNGVNLSVNRGDVVALVGESGCGKTTLAKMLLGLELQTSERLTFRASQWTNWVASKLLVYCNQFFRIPIRRLIPGSQSALSSLCLSRCKATPTQILGVNVQKK